MRTISKQPIVIRREFIRHVVVSATALGLGPTLHRLNAATKNARLDPEIVKKFAESVGGRVILPDDREQDRAARRINFWNPLTEKRPIVIVRCAGAEDVRRGVDFAREQNLEIAVRAGGHSYQGWGTCDGILLDLSSMKRIVINPTNTLAALMVVY